MNLYSCRSTLGPLSRWIGAGALVLVVVLGWADPIQAQDPPVEPDTAQTVDRTIEVRIASFRYDPDTLRIPAETTVRLVFRNEGNFDHEFTAGRRVTENVTGYQTDLFEDLEVERSRAEREQAASARPGTAIRIAPDSTESLTFRLPASKRGQWEMGCFLTDPASHYKAGMKGIILVK